jgi:putative AdoMet-dependent methyltransferase
MPRTEDETRQLFEAWAQSYADDVGNYAPGPLIGYQGSIEAVQGALPLHVGMHALDIGIGSGAVAAMLAAHGLDITGIDISPAMLAACKERHPTFALHTGTFNDIPLPDASVDVVASGFAFHEVPAEKRLHACQQMARVLKPGGYVCVLDIMFASEQAMAVARERLGRFWDPNELYAQVGDFDALLYQTGFSAVSWQQTAPYHWMVVAQRHIDA